MSIRKAVTSLKRSCIHVWQKDAFLSLALTRSDSTAGSRNESGSEFQTVGPATEKARMCQMCCDETNCRIFRLRRLAERRCWRPKTSEPAQTGTQQSARPTSLRKPRRSTPTLSPHEPKFHLARHVSTRLDSTHSTCRAHAFWLCRACRTARLDTLDTTTS